MKLFLRYRYTDDRQLVADLLAGNEKALECMLYDRYRGLLRFNAMKAAPSVPIDDLVQEFYLYLSADDWAKLKKYDSALPFERWLSVVSYRFFKDFSNKMIDSRRQIPITNIDDQEVLAGGTTQMSQIMMDIQKGFDELEPPRDREILKALLIDDEEPQRVADRYGVSVDNLYNIKRRALAKLIKKHLIDYAK